MKDVQTPGHVSLTTLIGRLRAGRYVIPNFQREFEWKPWDIRELMRSIFLDYYIGSLLLWKGDQRSIDALACEKLYGFQGNRSDATHIVLDGQQRLTAMYYAFVAPRVSAPSRKNRFLFFIRVDQFMDENYDVAFHYEWTRRGENLLNNETEQFESHMFPLAIVGKSGWSLAHWVHNYQRHWELVESSANENGDHITAEKAKHNAQNARLFGEHLKTITDQYQIVYIELDRNLELDKVCDIFTQINSRGIRLDVFDLINALMTPRGIQLKRLWREAKPRLDFVDTSRLNVYVLQVMSILRQAYCSPKYLYYLLPSQQKKIRKPDGSLTKEILIPDNETFERDWNKAVDALQDTISLLRHPQEFGAISSRYLPYVSILPVLAAAHSYAKRLPPRRQLDAHRKLRHWYWASVFTNRYSGSVESTSARDFLDLKSWFGDDDAIPSVISTFGSRFNSLDLRRETKRGTSVYNGIFNLLVLNGARDWMTGLVPRHSDLDDHHIVPKSWGKEYRPNSSIDTILNRTPLTAETNRRVIGSRLPNKYLPELQEDHGEDVVLATLESHFISRRACSILLRNPFTRSDYDDFLNERQRTLQAAIEDLLIKERLDLLPHLRELDASVESTELRLRDLVAAELEGDAAKLPSHVAQKIQRRIKSAANRNPILDPEVYAALKKMLEFADLRDLQDIIANRLLYAAFRSRFPNKDILAKRFDQLAELRNQIRHSRTVDGVTRRDGEAALLWFGGVLDLA
ncbi:MAG: DUF262 domain-containing protein [Bryobacterales bacterium]|nr:DUF262 domain-containing protein [Bryobacterales bacterium]